MRISENGKIGQTMDMSPDYRPVADVRRENLERVIQDVYGGVALRLAESLGIAPLISPGSARPASGLVLHTSQIPLIDVHPARQANLTLPTPSSIAQIGHKKIISRG